LQINRAAAIEYVEVAAAAGRRPPSTRDQDVHSSRPDNLGAMRQWIEAIYDTSKDQLDLEGHRGRTRAA
jgi:hypothetical protein